MENYQFNQMPTGLQKVKIDTHPNIFADKELYTCKKCHKKLPRLSFDTYGSLNGDLVRSPKCKTCQRGHREAVPYRYRIHNLSEREGKELDGRYHYCCICGDSPEPNLNTRKNFTLVIDHDHHTGEVRGLLCNNCNVGIGNLRDSIENLVKAIEYLKDPPERRRKRLIEELTLTSIHDSINMT